MALLIGLPDICSNTQNYNTIQHASKFRQFTEANSKNSTKPLPLEIHTFPQISNLPRSSHEKRVIQRLRRADALRRLVPQHPPHQIDALRPELGERRPLVERGRLRLRELEELRLRQRVRRVRVRHHARPVVGRRRPEERADPQQLVEVVLPGEERDPGDHLEDDAPDGPHVHGGAVVRVPEEHVRRAVPQRDDLVRVLFDGDAEGPPEPEVGDLQQHVVAVYQQVLRLEVAVEDIPRVAEGDAAEELLDEVAQNGARERVVVRVEELAQVHVEELEDDGQLVLAVEHLVHADDVGVPELHEDADLADRGARDALLVVAQADALEGDRRVRLAVARLVDDAVRALADALDFRVERGAHSVESGCICMRKGERGICVLGKGTKVVTAVGNAPMTNRWEMPTWEADSLCVFSDVLLLSHCWLPRLHYTTRCDASLCFYTFYRCFSLDCVENVLSARKCLLNE